MTSQVGFRPEDHWLLTGVPGEDLEPLLSIVQEQRFLPGEVLFREGDPATGLYLIMVGSVRVSATNETGETLLAVVHANDVLGEMAILDGRDRSGTATAVEICVAHFLPTEPFLDLLERSTKVCMRLLALLTTRLRRANGRLGELAATSAIIQEEMPQEGGTSGAWRAVT